MGPFNLIIRFASEAAKKKYKTRESKKHSWSCKYYVVCNIYNYSETSIAQMMLINDIGEIWFVDTRDIRVINFEEYSWDGK